MKNDRLMCPYEIKLLLHYHAIPEPHPDADRDVPIFRESIHRFLEEGLLEPQNASPYYYVTERGEAYVKAICNVPLPVQVWIIPERVARCT